MCRALRTRHWLFNKNLIIEVLRVEKTRLKSVSCPDKCFFNIMWLVSRCSGTTLGFQQNLLTLLEKWKKLWANHHSICPSKFHNVSVNFSWMFGGYCCNYFLITTAEEDMFWWHGVYLKFDISWWLRSGKLHASYMKVDRHEKIVNTQWNAAVNIAFLALAIPRISAVYQQTEWLIGLVRNKFYAIWWIRNLRWIFRFYML